MPDLSPTDDEPSEGELIHKWLDTQRQELQVAKRTNCAKRKRA